MRALARLRLGLLRHVSAAADLLWPPCCPGCEGRAEPAERHWCGGCWSRLRPLRAGEERWALDDGAGNGPVAHAAFVVDGLFLDMLAASKYRRFRRVGRHLAGEAAARLAPRLPRGTLVPVPLRADRRRDRGFNQTEDFAHALAARTGLRVAADWLVRRGAGPALAGLPREQRARVVRNAFTAGAAYPGASAGPVILVDDVVTTGSTARACTAALAAAGGRAETVAAMARAFASVRDASPPDLEVLARL